MDYWLIFKWVFSILVVLMLLTSWGIRDNQFDFSDLVIVPILLSGFLSLFITTVISVSIFIIGDNQEKQPYSVEDDYGEEDDYPSSTSNDGSHFVEPYERELPSGETIWVDGDGDTSVDRSVEEGGGWTQGNP